MNYNAAHRNSPSGWKNDPRSTSPNADYVPTYNPYENVQPPPQIYEPYRTTNQQHYGGSGGYKPYQSGPTPPPDQSFSIGSQYLSDPIVTKAAMQYGQHLMGSGKDYVDREFQKYVPVSKLKYYFAVDTSYVCKKLQLLLFPFTHGDWSVRYASDDPIQPRYEVNAPDLYIPTMAYLTYVLIAAFALGTQDRFTPEVLSIQASSALAWTILEVFIHLLSFYVTNINTALTTVDIVAFSGYKFVGIIFAIIASLLFHKLGYYSMLLYCSFSLCFFLARTLKMKILPISSGPAGYGDDQHHIQNGNKRRLYLLLFMVGIQPVLMWWLSYHLVAISL